MEEGLTQGGRVNEEAEEGALERQDRLLPANESDLALRAGISLVQQLEFARGSWWQHDAQWFRAVAHRWGLQAANEANLEAAERATRAAVLRLRREGAVGPVRDLHDLESVFRLLWWLFFPEGHYQDSEFVIDGEEGYWIGKSCHAFEQLCRGDLLAGYECGCRAFRDGVKKGLGVSFTHEISESLVAGDQQCRVVFRMQRAPQAACGGTARTSEGAAAAGGGSRPAAADQGAAQ
jgi:hypothetical protein